MLTQVTLAALLGRYLWYYLHYTNGGNQGTQQLSNLPKFTQLVSDEAGNWTQAGSRVQAFSHWRRENSLVFISPNSKESSWLLRPHFKDSLYPQAWLTLTFIGLFSILALPKEMPGIEEHLPLNFLPLRSELRLVQNHFWWCHSW